jgi:hypothetical protein
VSDVVILLHSQLDSGLFISLLVLLLVLLVLVFDKKMI